MDIVLAGALLATLLAVLIGAAVFLKAGKGAAKGPSDGATEQDQAQDAPAGAARRGAADRMRAGRLRQQAQAQNRAAAADRQAAQADSDGGSGSGSEDEEEEEGQRGGAGKKGKKGRTREDRREAREAERAAREVQGNKRSAYEERRRQKDAEREARERAQEEEIARAAAERQAKEDEEAAKWMSLISVEKEGTVEAEDAAESQGLLAQFVEYITSRKSVPLDQLALEFKLRTSEVIDRIRGLEDMGRLTGVMDERGKYIFISREEMKAVAAYITSKGRVAISELAAKSNTFIDLEVKAAAATSQQGPTIDFDALLGGEVEAAA